jgi:hypothetical protein
MSLFLVFFWCAAVAGGILRFNSRFGVFNSRLGWRQFPFSPATGIGLQGLDLVRCLRHQNGRYRGKSAKFPVPREEPGISPPPAEGAMGLARHHASSTQATDDACEGAPAGGCIGNAASATPMTRQ